VAAPDSRQDPAAREIGEAAVAQAILSRVDDSAESVPGTSFAPWRDVGLVGSGVVVASEILFRVDDSAESHAVESCGPDAPPRSLLDRLLDEAEALRGAAAAGHGVAPDPSDAERGSGGVAKSGRAPDSLRDRAAAARRAFNRADALVAVAQGHLRGDRPERCPVEVVLTVPASSLRAGAAIDPIEVGEMGESFVSSETARRLSCDAGVVEVIQDEQGVPLSVGRRSRSIGAALKRALRKRDETCSFPGCTNRIFLEGHHIQHWADGGETSLRNTALLCSSHHRHVHEYGYTVELGPDQRPRFRDPQGRCVAAVPERPRVAELGWPQIRAANEALKIDADTIAGPWDGTPVNYGRIVGHLAVAEGLA
jgi:hypothetical protein